MDLKVIKKRDTGAGSIVVDDVFDIQPVFGNADGTHNESGRYLLDAISITDSKAEQLDRALFAIMKSQGQDPLALDDGVQWSEYMLGEVPDAVLIHQISQAVQSEGKNLKLSFSQNDTKMLSLSVKVI